MKKTFFLIFLPFCIHAVELMPWFGPSFEIETRFNYALQSFNHVETRHGKENYLSYDNFYSTEFLLPIYDKWCFELEVGAFNSKKHSTNWNALAFTTRYKWLNDIIGDPVTLTTGLTILKVFKAARRDLAVFHHGGIEAEAHVALGKEFSYLQFWTSRWWATGGVGIADLGAPWIFGDIVWEVNWCNSHQLGFFLETLWGLGTRSLSLKKAFHGYGPIRHQSADVGIYYEYLLEKVSGKLRGEYAYRIYSHNCPKKVSFFMISFNYPIGLGI